MSRQIILIMTDSQRADMVGCYGNKDMITPNIDKLSEEGIRFNKAYTVQPVCGPARSALFTGLYPHTTGMWSNSQGLDSGVKTIGERLDHKGIKSAYIGKWHLDGGDYFGYGKCPKGWDKDYWYDMKNYLDELSDEDKVRSRNPNTVFDGITEEFTFGHRCSNRAIDFIENHKDEDFLLVVSYDEPHDPYLCPEKYVNMYKDYSFPIRESAYDTLENKPEHQKIWGKDEVKKDKKNINSKYPFFFGVNTFIDNEIGRVVKAYKKYTPDALIIYTSDHGAFLNSHCLWAKGPSTYDDITRIPFIISGTKVKDNMCINNHVVSHIDIVPTILDYFNIDKYKMLTGKSLIPLLEDGEKKINDEVFMEFGRYEVDHDGFGGFQPLRSVFDGRYKLTINLLSTDELYDLDNDKDEMNNLIEDKGTEAIRNHLHDKLLNWMNDTRDPFRGYYWERRPWRKDAKEATWRYTGYTRQKEEDYDESRQLDYANGLTMKDAVRVK